MIIKYHGTKDLKLNFNNQTSFGAGTYVAYGCGFRYVSDNPQKETHSVKSHDTNKESE